MQRLEQARLLAAARNARNVPELARQTAEEDRRAAIQVQFVLTTIQDEEELEDEEERFPSIDSDDFIDDLDGFGIDFDDDTAGIEIVNDIVVDEMAQTGEAGSEKGREYV